MNTLSRTYTSAFFDTPEEYAGLQVYWSKLVNSSRKHDLRPEHHLLYLTLLGRNYTSAFSPITNRNKLDNGMHRMQSLENALQAISWPLKFKMPTQFDRLVAPFDGLVSREMVVAVNKLLPDYRLKEPVVAYIEPEAVDAVS